MSSNIRTLVLEGVGTCLLVFLSIASAVLGVASYVGIEGQAPGTTVTAAALLVALIVLGLITAIGPLSRSHITPGVTLAVLRRRGATGEVAVDSWIGQVIGAVVAGVAVFFLVPWFTGTSSTSGSPSAVALDLSDALLAAVLAVGLLAAPLLGVLIAAAFGTRRLMLVAAPTPTPPASPVLVPPMAVAIVPPPPEPVLEPVLEPAFASEPEPVATEPEPTIEPAPIIIEPAYASSAPITPSRPSPPRAPLPAPRSTPSPTRVTAAFPPSPVAPGFPVRRPIPPADRLFPFTASRPSGEKAVTNAPEHKATKGKKAKKQKKQKTKSTVTVQVKVTDHKKSEGPSSKSKKKDKKSRKDKQRKKK